MIQYKRYRCTYSTCEAQNRHQIIHILCKLIFTRSNTIVVVFLRIFHEVGILGWIRNDFKLLIAILFYSFDNVLICFKLCGKMCVEYGVRMRKGGAWRRMDACGCVTDAYECIPMHMDASGCRLGTRY